MLKEILAVDDEEDICRLLQFVLEREGYVVRTALSGVEALQRVDEKLPDLIICDIMMPHMDGEELLRRLKTRSDTQNIPVVMLTARTGDQVVEEVWNLGAELYLSKPFSPLELLSFVKRILSASESSGS